MPLPSDPRLLAASLARKRAGEVFISPVQQAPPASFPNKPDACHHLCLEDLSGGFRCLECGSQFPSSEASQVAGFLWYE